VSAFALGVGLSAQWRQTLRISVGEERPICCMLKLSAWARSAPRVGPGIARRALLPTLHDNSFTIQLLADCMKRDAKSK